MVDEMKVFVLVKVIVSEVTTTMGDVMVSVVVVK